jgi:hypothetical protein
MSEALDSALLLDAGERKAKGAAREAIGDLDGAMEALKAGGAISPELESEIYALKAAVASIRGAEGSGKPYREGYFIEICGDDRLELPEFVCESAEELADYLKWPMNRAYNELWLTERAERGGREAIRLKAGGRMKKILFVRKEGTPAAETGCIQTMRAPMSAK